MFLILLIVNVLFIYFFWKINFVYWIYLVTFFLSIFFVLSFFSDEWKSDWKLFLKKFFLNYLSYLNFFLVGLWVFFILKYFFLLHDISILADLKALVTILLWICLFYILSVFLWKKDFIKLSYFWITVIFIALNYYLHTLKIFYYYVALVNTISIVWHLIYFIRFWKYSRFINYINFIFLTITFFIFISQYIVSSTVIFSFIIQVIIAVILLVIIYINNLYNKIESIEDKLKNIQYELNLFWFSETKLDKKEEEFYKKHIKNKDNYFIIVDFFINSPTYIKVLFSLTNTIPIIIASYSFFHQIDSISRLQNEIFYWFGAIMYFINFLLFKKLNWFVVIQRLFAFFVINFVTYFTIIDIFWENYLFIAIWWIIWNLLATVVILFIWKKGSIFSGIDYLIWTIVNFIWVFVNIYFLFKIWLNTYLISWIILLYLGFYLFLYRIIYKRLFL